MDEVRQGCIDALKKLKEIEVAYDSAVWERFNNQDEYQALRQQLVCAQAVAIIWLKAYAKIDINEEVKP